MSYALARRQRLCEPGQFKAVFDGSRRFSIGALTVLVRANGLDYSRLGLVVSRKSAARAVDRNRIKRVVRDSFRRHQAQLVAIDVVVLAKPGVTNRTNNDLFGDLDAAWSRVSRWQNSSSH